MSTLRDRLKVAIAWLGGIQITHRGVSSDQQNRREALQVMRDALAALDAHGPTPRWPDETFRNILRRSVLNLTESQIVGVAVLVRESAEKWREAVPRPAECREITADTREELLAKLGPLAPVAEELMRRMAEGPAEAPKDDLAARRILVELWGNPEECEDCGDLDRTCAVHAHRGIWEVAFHLEAHPCPGEGCATCAAAVRQTLADLKGPAEAPALAPKETR